MATKWKYATIPADQRLSMLKDGNDELYNEEIARTQDAISNRLAAGLDVSEQMKWADTVSYNHNLSKAKNMGVDESTVAKDGYAEKLFGNMTESIGTKKVSTVTSPTALYDKKYYSDYETMDRDDVAKSVADSYIRGINERAALLSSEYNKYVSDLDKEYEKKIRDAYKAYMENEKLYEENRANSGFSERGGRTLTEKAKTREQYYDYVKQLQTEKNDMKQKAQDSLKSSLYDLSGAAMKDIADEYYRYNSLLSDEQAAEYEKLRDSAADNKWWHEFSLKKTESENDENARQREYALSKEKEENDKLIALRELAFRQSESAADYEKWLKEFEADTRYNNAKLSADIESDRQKTALDREKLALDREKFEYQKDGKEAEPEEAAGNKTGDETESEFEPAEKYGEYYKTCLAAAQRMAQLVMYDETEKRYVPRYSSKELFEWVKKFDLSEAEKKSICSNIGIKYIEE